MALKNIFAINLGLGILACLSHFPAVVLKFVGNEEFESVNLALVLPLLPLDLILVAGGAVGLIKGEAYMGRILPVHAVALLLLAVGVVGILLRLLLFEFPETNFSFAPGIGAAFVGYSVYVGRLAFCQGGNPRFSTAEWYAGGIVLAVELVVLYKFHVTFFVQAGF